MGTGSPERAPLRDILAAFALAGVHGVLLQWEALRDPYRFMDNWRQSPHWISPARSAFQPDDLLLRYAEFNTAPFENLLYKGLAALGPDILWGKILGILFYAVTAAVVYITGHAIRGRFGGLVATCVFLLFPSSFVTFAGGFSSGMSMPLLCLGVLFVYLGRWWLFVPLIALEVLVYPMVAIQTGAMLIVDTAWHDLRRLRDRTLWTEKLVPLAIAAAICGLGMAAKYASPHDFGHLTDRTEIGSRVEFGQQGRVKLLPVRPLSGQLAKFWSGSFHIALAAAAFVGLGRRMLRLPRGIGSLFVASALLYWLADLLLIRLYFPTRYVWRSLPLIVMLVAAYWMGEIRLRATNPLSTLHPALGRLRRVPVWIAAAVVVLAVGVNEFHGTFIPPGKAEGNTYYRFALYDAIRNLPGRPMVAAPPRKASELPLLTGKTMLVTKEFSHPWWTDFWDTIVERTHDFYRGYYTDSPRVVRRITLKHDIDYWVIDRKDFARGRQAPGRDYHEPFGSWVRANVRPRSPGVLISAPPDVIVPIDERYFFVPRDALLRWLDAEAHGAR